MKKKNDIPKSFRVQLFVLVFFLAKRNKITNSIKGWGERLAGQKKKTFVKEMIQET
jgi:predicted PurR-regulated permease PerM